jgi:hypothetical protein
LKKRSFWNRYQLIREAASGRDGKPATDNGRIKWLKTRHHNRLRPKPLRLLNPWHLPLLEASSNGVAKAVAVVDAVVRAADKVVARAADNRAGGGIGASASRMKAALNQPW